MDIYELASLHEKIKSGKYTEEEFLDFYHEVATRSWKLEYIIEVLEQISKEKGGD